MSQRSNIDAAVLLKWFFRHNLRKHHESARLVMTLLHKSPGGPPGLSRSTFPLKL
jgi:hypothetical protein